MEDEFIIQIFIKRIISSIGCEIVGACSTSDEVFDLIDKLSPNLILLDISIEGTLDGIETAKLINSKYNIPIIFITGNNDIATINDAKKTNPLYIINKPVSEENLIKHFNKACRKLEAN